MKRVRIQISLPLSCTLFLLAFGSSCFSYGLSSGQIFWLKTNFNSPAPKYLLISENAKTRMLLGVPSECADTIIEATDLEIKKTVRETATAVAQIKKYFPTLRYNVETTFDKILKEKMLPNPSVFQITIVLVPHSDFTCAGSGTSTVTYDNLKDGTSYTMQNAPSLHIALGEFSKKGARPLRTIAHEFGHLVQRAVGLRVGALEETFPDFLELSLFDWDFRIGQGDGIFAQEKLSKILRDSTISEDEKKYNQERLALASSQAIRDLSKVDTLPGILRFPSPYIISAHVNGFFWHLSKTVSPKLISKAVFEEIALHEEVIFSDPGFAFVQRVVDRLENSDHETMNSPTVKELLFKNGIKRRN